MDEEGIPVNLDYTKIEGIDINKSYSYINNFLVTCYSLLNKYSSYYEDKFAKIENDEMYLVAQLDALEAKLESVDGLKALSSAKELNNNNVVPNANIEPTIPSVDVEETIPDEVTPQENTIEIGKHPKYKKFFDMKKYGVPDPQIQLNMKNNGIDPNTIDLSNPNKLVNIDNPLGEDKNEDSQSFDSDFSD